MKKDLQSIIDYTIKRMQEHNKKKKEFFQSERFNEIFDIISSYDYISQDELLYGVKEIEGLDADSFKDVVESIFYVADTDICYDNSYDFPIMHTDYKGMRFEIILGQGSCYFSYKL